MRRFIPFCFLLALVVSAPVQAGTSVSIGVTLGNAPPPPALVFDSQPHLTVMATTGVWYYSGPCDYDYFRYGQSYYIYNSGYWYRAHYARGPFVAIHEQYVPRVFYGLHDRGYQWRHGWKHAPQSQYRTVDNRERQGDRGRGHGPKEQHGNKGGHGRGHNKD